ncbi:hypothetical protein [Mesorhizobium sp. B2-1-2]|uniref:hypothetical protein n=1 Tax=Mesorhizobium sp. B2-1-2 TaxID=2589973 RepID=UPI001129A806|nr:hypothetical protein [Mesorhizobium sp. B2-1-2]TPN11747.1 hypothetical protein FJ971_10095 [Mesorhizobium sp. B2-1-2]
MQPSIEKTTLGAIIGIGLQTPDETPVRLVDTAKVCWVVWPACIDDQAAVYLDEAEALYDLDRQLEREP